MEFYRTAFTDFLKKHCDKWGVNERKLQSNWLDVCGQYCIFFLTHRAHGYSMNKLVDLFGNDTVLNDSKVSGNVTHLFVLFLISHQIFRHVQLG